MEEHGYPIRAVCKMTGLSSDTLRAWERRYNAVHPERRSNGRMYTPSDIQRLQLLKSAVESGHRIGKVAELNNQQLNELVSRSQPEVRDPVANQIRSIIDACSNYDFGKVDASLERLAAFIPAGDFIFQVAIPLMQEAQKANEAEEMNMSQKHALLVMLRSVLATLSRVQSQRMREQDHDILFTTPPQGSYEFSILLASVMAAYRGRHILYPGPNLPIPEIAKIVRKTGVKSLVLWVSEETGARPSMVAAMRDLRERLPVKVDLVMGGTLQPEIAAQFETLDMILTQDLAAFDRWLSGQ